MFKILVYSYSNVTSCRVEPTASTTTTRTYDTDAGKVSLTKGKRVTSLLAMLITAKSVDMSAKELSINNCRNLAHLTLIK